MEAGDSVRSRQELLAEIAQLRSELAVARQARAGGAFHDRSDRQGLARADGATVAAEAAVGNSSDLMLAAVLDGTGDVVFVKGADGRYLLMNRVGAQLVGRPAAKLVGASNDELFPGESPARQAAVRADDERAMRLPPGQSLRLHETVVTPHGPRHYLTTKSPYRDAAGQVIGVVGVARDVTELIEGNEALQRAKAAAEAGEARFRELADTMLQIVWTARPDGHVDYYNRRWYDVAGAPRDRFGDESWAPAIHPDDLPAVADRWAAAVRSGEPMTANEFRLFDARTGGYRWYLGRATPVRDGDGAVVRWVGTTTDIHDRKAAEQAAVENERRHRALFEALPTIAWVNRPDGAVEYFNQLWTQYTGLSDRPTGLEWLSAVHPDDAPRAVAVRSAAIARGEGYEVDLRFRRAADGAYRWHQARVVPLHDAAGRRFAWLGTAADVDDLYRAQEAVRASERKLRVTLEGARVGVWHWDVAADAVDWSPEIHAMLGTDPSAGPLRYVDWLDRLHPDDRADAERAWRDAVAARADKFRHEFRVTHPALGLRWIEDVARIEYGPDGAPTRLDGVNIDVTERRRTEQAVRDGQAKLRAIINGSTAVIYAKDLDGRYLLVNHHWERLFGVTAEQTVGLTDYDFFPPETSDAVRANDRRVLAQGHTVEVEEVVRHPDGSVHTYISLKFPLADAAGTVYGVCGVSTDITERKRADADHRESRERLQAALTASGTGTFRWDIRTGGLTFDENLDRMFGLPPGQTVRAYDEFLARIHPDDRDRVAAAGARCREHGGDFDEEYRVVRPDGSVRWVDDKGRTFRGPDGQPAYMTGACVDVTHRKRAERDLRERDEFNRAVFDSSPDCLKVLDADGRLLAMNAAGMCLMEIDDFGAVAAQEWWSLWPEDSRRRVRAAVVAAQTGGSDRFQAFCPTAKGTMKWWDVIVTPVRAADGHVRQLISVSRDITALKQAEEVVREGERRIRLLLDSTAEGIYGIDRAGNCTFANSACARLLGYAGPDDLVGRNMHALVHHRRPDGAGYALDDCPIHRALREHRGVHVDDEVFWRKDGTSLPVEYWSYPAIAREGQVEAAVVTFFDTTDRRRAEDALRASEARFRQMADAMPQMVWVTRADGHHEYYNRRWYDFTGVPAGATDGDAWDTVLHPDDRDRAWARWRHSLATGEPYEVEYRLRHRTGEYRWTLGRALAIRDDGAATATAGPVARWVGTCTDVHEQTLLRDALDRARNEAERANRAKDEFLAALSHELRTPLAPVLLTTQMLEGDPSLPDDLRRDMGVIRRNVEIEVRLIDDLLDLTRVARGKVHLQSAAADLHDVVRHAVDTCRDDTFVQKRLDLRLDLAAADAGVWADAPRLAQVFWNLVKNAVKFTPAGGAITVRTANPAPGRVAVAVTDTGCGIDPGVLPAIFNAFEQGGPDVTRQFGGLGLGLAISRALVDLHGGEITVASAGKGHGATFTVTLPTCPLPATPAPVGTGAPAAATVSPARRAPDRNPRILLVEDHRQSGQVLRRLLTRLGYDVEWADTAAAALRAADHVAAAPHRPFDLVISDLGLPDATGHDLMRELRRRHNLRGIALSGYGMDDDLARSTDAGFLRHLVKPVSLPLLQATLQDLVG
jgi:PAS domain S-box-containing protein